MSEWEFDESLLIGANLAKIRADVPSAPVRPKRPQGASPPMQQQQQQQQQTFRQQSQPQSAPRQQGMDHSGTAGLGTFDDSPSVGQSDASTYQHQPQQPQMQQRARQGFDGGGAGAGATAPLTGGAGAGHVPQAQAHMQRTTGQHHQFQQGSQQTGTGFRARPMQQQQQQQHRQQHYAQNESASSGLDAYGDDGFDRRNSSTAAGAGGFASTGGITMQTPVKRKMFSGSDWRTVGLFESPSGSFSQGEGAHGGGARRMHPQQQQQPQSQYPPVRKPPRDSVFEQNHDSMQARHHREDFTDGYGNGYGAGEGGGNRGGRGGGGFSAPKLSWEDQLIINEANRYRMSNKHITQYDPELNNLQAVYTDVLMIRADKAMYHFVENKQNSIKDAIFLPNAIAKAVGLPVQGVTEEADRILNSRRDLMERHFFKLGMPEADSSDMATYKALAWALGKRVVTNIMERQADGSVAAAAIGAGAGAAATREIEIEPKTTEDGGTAGGATNGNFIDKVKNATRTFFNKGKSNGAAAAGTAQQSSNASRAADDARLEQEAQAQAQAQARQREQQDRLRASSQDQDLKQQQVNLQRQREQQLRLQQQQQQQVAAAAAAASAATTATVHSPTTAAATPWYDIGEAMPWDAATPTTTTFGPSGAATAAAADSKRRTAPVGVGAATTAAATSGAAAITATRLPVAQPVSATPVPFVGATSAGGSAPPISTSVGGVGGGGSPMAPAGTLSRAAPPLVAQPATAAPAPATPGTGSAAPPLPQMPPPALPVSRPTSFGRPPPPVRSNLLVAAPTTASAPLPSLFRSAADDGAAPAAATAVVPIAAASPAVPRQQAQQPPRPTSPTPSEVTVDSLGGDF
jgi:hypothetical protein